MITIHYKLIGTGWAVCRVRIGRTGLEATASNLGNALGDFAKAVVRLIDGEPSAHFSFIEPPGEYAWTLRRRHDDVQCRLERRSEWRGWGKAERVKVEFDETVPLLEFVRAFELALASILTKYGTAGYRDLWARHDFPLAEHERIRAFLGLAITNLNRPPVSPRRSRRR